MILIDIRSALNDSTIYDNSHFNTIIMKLVAVSAAVVVVDSLVVCCCVSRHGTFIMTWFVWNKNKKLCEHSRRIASDAYEYKRISNSIFRAITVSVIVFTYCFIFAACPRFAIFFLYFTLRPLIVWKHLQFRFISLPLNRMYYMKVLKRGTHVEIPSCCIFRSLSFSLSLLCKLY